MNILSYGGPHSSYSERPLAYEDKSFEENFTLNWRKVLKAKRVCCCKGNKDRSNVCIIRSTGSHSTKS